MPHIRSWPSNYLYAYPLRNMFFLHTIQHYTLVANVYINQLKYFHCVVQVEFMTPCDCVLLQNSFFFSDFICQIAHRAQSGELASVVASASFKSSAIHFLNKGFCHHSRCSREWQRLQSKKMKRTRIKKVSERMYLGRKQTGQNKTG